MATVAPLDRLTGTIDSLAFTVDTVGDKVAWTATVLDHMDGWGALDNWNYGPLDTLSLEVKVGGGSADIAATATSDSVRLKGVSAAVGVAVTASSASARIRTVLASVNAVSTATTAFARVRPFEALVDAVGTAALDGTRIRTVAGTASMSASATSNSNFVTLASGQADTAITVTGNILAVFNGASTARASVSQATVVKILGDEWGEIDSGSEVWSDASVGVPPWTIVTTASGTWLGQ
jgi:hypothetical protein